MECGDKTACVLSLQLSDVLPYPHCHGFACSAGVVVARNCMKQVNACTKLKTFAQKVGFQLLRGCWGCKEQQCHQRGEQESPVLWG